MIKRFEVGKRYRYTHNTRFNAWTKHMDCVTDGKPRLCTKASKTTFALFEGMQRHLSTYQDGMWNWIDGFRFWEEVPQFKRGDKVVVWDKEDGLEFTCDFITCIEGARLPYIVTTNIKKEPFEISDYLYCKPEDSKLKELTAVLVKAQSEYDSARKALQEASEKYDAYKKEH